MLINFVTTYVYDDARNEQTVKKTRVVWCTFDLFQLLIKRAVTKGSLTRVLWLAHLCHIVAFYNATTSKIWCNKRCHAIRHLWKRWWRRHTHNQVNQLDNIGKGVQLLTQRTVSRLEKSKVVTTSSVKSLPSHQISITTTESVIHCVVKCVYYTCLIMKATDMKLFNEIIQAYESVIILTWAFNAWRLFFMFLNLIFTNKIRCCKWGS